MMMRKNKKAWIKIVEAFIAVLLVTVALLILLNRGYFGGQRETTQVYDVQVSILREIRLDDQIRSDILSVDNSSLPVSWNDTLFPPSVKEKIIDRVPAHLECVANICHPEAT